MTSGVLAVALLLSTAPATAPATASGPRAAAGVSLDVPIVEQTRERCGPAALAMVLRYYGAAPAAFVEAEGAYDPVLRGALITDLAEAARRGGFDASVAKLTADSLIALLHEGAPPIVLYQNGRAPLTVPHYGVIKAWDPARASFTLNDGRARPRVMRRAELERRWRTAGFQALIVRRGQP